MNTNSKYKNKSGPKLDRFYFYNAPKCVIIISFKKIKKKTIMAIWTGLRRKPLPVLREVKMGNYRDTPEGEVSIGDTYLIAEFTMPTGKIQAVSFTFPKGFPEDQAAHCGLHLEQMVGRKIKYVFRHTEELWFTFEDGHLWAFCRKPQP